MTISLRKKKTLRKAKMAVRTATLKLGLRKQSKLSWGLERVRYWISCRVPMEK